jgi:hypothetical protein
MDTIASAPLSRKIPLWLIVLCAFAFHGPLLMMQLPANSFDANFHMSMASHYAHKVLSHGRNIGPYRDTPSR